MVANQVQLLDDAQLHFALDGASGDVVARETGGVMEIRFGHEMLSVFVNRLDADSKQLRHSFVPAPLSDKLEHFDLARAEAIPLVSEPAVWIARHVTSAPNAVCYQTSYREQVKVVMRYAGPE